MGNMFSVCRSLTELNLSNFDTSRVTNMSYMFMMCYGLTELNLSHFDTSVVRNMGMMFYVCSSLTKITAGCDWTTENANTSAMFNGAGVSEVTVVC